MSNRREPKPLGLEGLISQTPAALETLRILIDRPAGSRIAELEKSGSDPMQVVRILHHLQTAGLVNIHIERTTHELVARVPEKSVEKLKGLLTRLS